MFLEWPIQETVGNGNEFWGVRKNDTTVFGTHVVDKMLFLFQSAVIALFVSCFSHAFQAALPLHDTFRRSAEVHALATAEGIKQNLQIIASELAVEQGVFLYDQSSKEELEKAVSELESVADTPTKEVFDSQYAGDWRLICTTATNTKGVNTDMLTFLNDGPLSILRRSLAKRFDVVQRIRSMSESGVVDRVDHVVEVQPVDSLSMLFESLPDSLSSFNINPLELRTAKITLVHKADIESFHPIPRTKISLESIVLTVAGTSQYLDPAGADVFGINLPLGEFLNSGTFDTTYIDEDIRISRGRLGLVDQLRVFEKIKEEQPSTENELVDGILSTGTQETVVLGDEAVNEPEESGLVVGELETPEEEDREEAGDVQGMEK